MISRPMLAGTVEDVAALPFPMIASPKLDGIRALIVGGKLLSRSLKPIPNRFVRETLERLAHEGMDGELLVGSNFQDCTSAIMSREGEPDFAFACFDLWSDPAGYSHRIATLDEAVARIGDARISAVPTELLHDVEALAAYEARALAQGFEGVMLRRPEGPYKQGRSTLREGYLLKLKRFEDAEATVIGFEELMHNENIATVNELGLTKRSSAKGGKRPAGTLGTLLCRLPSGIEFGIGAGLTEALRAEIWEARDRFTGAIVKFKHQPHGAKDAPRLPVFLGFRAAEDL